MGIDELESVPPNFVDGLFDLDGRVAVVTGGGSGLGAAIAMGLAQAGAHVAILDINLEGTAEVARIVRTQGGDARCYEVDVTSKSAVLAAADRIAESDGGVDILVNSAGSAFRSPAEEFPEEKFDFIVDLNLKGTYLCCQAFGAKMLEARRGSIINVLSIGAFVAYPHASAYLASKGGVLQLTRSLALEWHERNVRVNGIAPTLMQSPLTRAGTAQTSVTSDFIQQRMLRTRLGLPRELIGAAIFLASDASTLVTGHTIMCDDGYTIV